MKRAFPLAAILRAVALTLVGLFFLFPIFWVLLLSIKSLQSKPSRS